MAIDLPQSSIKPLPTIPAGMKQSHPLVYDHLQKLHAAIDQLTRGHFNNDLNISNVIGSGVSGTFAIASGGHIVVTSGIVISVTTT